jgi:glycosyltransferase involved in cell wall biosynthesis
MKWEQMAADALGADWHVRMYAPDLKAVSSLSSTGKLRAWLKLRRGYYRWLSQVQDRYDVLLLRYYVHDPFQLAFARNSCKPIYFVHHTLEVPELAMPGHLSDWARARLESVLGPYSIRRAQGIVCVTPEIARYEVRRSGKDGIVPLIFPNGIIYSGATVEDHRERVPQLLFVASLFSSWHGLDRLIDSIRTSVAEFKLHLVGDVGQADRVAIGANPRIIMHNSLSHSDIASLASHCDVGLSSFALDRNGMEEACTLKVRECLMLGLPVYAGYHDVFPEDFPYYRRGVADIEAITRFAAEMRGVSRSEVSTAAKPYIDKKTLLAELIDDLEHDLRQ